ncbi:MAG: hypothetical protein FWF87_04270 [Synergistaceae bacterium]|nr:hypothetical protein [Synergistaceae bacterium]
MKKAIVRRCISLLVFLVTAISASSAWADIWKLKAEEESAYVEMYSPMKTQLEYWLKGVPDTEEGRSFKALCRGMALSDNRSPKRFDLEQFVCLFERAGEIQNGDDDSNPVTELFPRIVMRAGEAFVSVGDEGSNKISGET